MPEKPSRKERRAAKEQARADALRPLLERLGAADAEGRLAAARELREAVTGSQPPSLEALVQAGFVPELLRAAAEPAPRELPFEALWALSELLQGSSDHASAVLDAGGAEGFLKLLVVPSSRTQEQACGILRRLAEASPLVRDRLLESGAGLQVLRVLHAGKDVEQRTMYDEEKKAWRVRPGAQADVPEALVRAAAGCLAALCAGEPAPVWGEALLPLMHTLEVLIMSPDEEVVLAACRALCTFDFTQPVVVGMVVKFGICTQLVELLGHGAAAVRSLAARAAERVARGSKHGMMAILLHEPAESLKYMLDSEEISDQLEGCSLLAAMLAVGGPHIKEALDAGCLPPLLALLRGAGEAPRQAAARAAGALVARCPAAKVAELMPPDSVAPMVRTLECAAYVSGRESARAALDFVEGVLRSDRQLRQSGFVQALRAAAAVEALRRAAEAAGDKDFGGRARALAELLDGWESHPAGGGPPAAAAPRPGPLLAGAAELAKVPGGESSLVAAAA